MDRQEVTDESANRTCQCTVISYGHDSQAFTYLTCYVCNRARCNFPHLDNLRNMFLDLEAVGRPPSAPVILDDIRAVTVTFDVLCRRRRCEHRFESLKKLVRSTSS